MAEACDCEMFQRSLWVPAFYPPGGTPRLYGRQDAHRYGKAPRCLKNEMAAEIYSPRSKTSMSPSEVVMVSRSSLI